MIGWYKKPTKVLLIINEEILTDIDFSNGLRNESLNDDAYQNEVVLYSHPYDYFELFGYPHC